ncbi:MAG: ParB/RepB/Spo0J family partition protein [Elainellaceae cyanobacterium]
MAKQAIATYQFKGRGVTALLGQDTTEGSESTSIPLAHITLPTQQPRQYFDPKALQDLAASIRMHGILTPLLVRSAGKNSYELVAGERRFRAAQELGLAEVPVLIRKLSDIEASEVALLENLQREDLNPVEETEGILELLEQKLKKSREEVIALLNLSAHLKRASVQNVLHSSEWKTVEAVFTSVGRFSPNSFRASRLPLLKLPADVLAVLRQGKIEYTKALAISRLKNLQARQRVLEEAIAQKLSLKQIKQRLRQAQAKAHPLKKTHDALEARWIKAYPQLRKPHLWANTETREHLERIVGEIESLLLRHGAESPTAEQSTDHPNIKKPLSVKL